VEQLVPIPSIKTCKRISLDKAGKAYRLDKPLQERKKIQHGVSMKKLFIGNLSWKASEDTLKPLFEQYGNVVSIKIIVDQYTGKSKGFGFVEMETADEAEKAINGLNDKPVLDRNMRVSLAQERTDRPDRGNGGNGGGYGGGSRDRAPGGGNRDSRGDGQRSFRPRSERSFG
jgi:RNA recognition motif-containing protein